MQTPVMVLGVLAAAGAAWLVSCGKPMTIEGELAKAPAEDRQALDAVLEGTGLAASQLTSIGAGVARGFGVLQHHQHAVAVEDGRIVELRLSDVPLPHLEALTRLTGLQALWLSGNHLTVLPDLSALKQLVFLDLSQNPLHDLAFLPNPKPANLVLKTDLDPPPAPAPPAAPVHPANWVQKAPNSKGKASKGKAGRGSIEGFVAQGAYSVKGTLASLEGAIDEWNIQGNYNTGGAGGSTVEISVEKGRVRAYLQYVPPGDKFFKRTDGYVYAEAEPGKPGKVQGILPAFSSDEKFTLTVESVDGKAEGIRYHIYR